jgi:hypothetical protein
MELARDFCLSAGQVRDILRSEPSLMPKRKPPAPLKRTGRKQAAQRDALIAAAVQRFN